MSFIENIINIILHVFILLLILTLIFWVVITQIEKQEINNLIENATDSAFSNTVLSPEEKDIVTTSLPSLQRLATKYSNPDPLIESNNSWLLLVNILYVAFIFISLISVLLTMSFVCGLKNFPLYGIVKENIVFFTILAVIEVLFFYYIALKYVPILPSDVTKSSINEIQNNF